MGISFRFSDSEQLDEHVQFYAALHWIHVGCHDVVDLLDEYLFVPCVERLGQNGNHILSYLEVSDELVIRSYFLFLLFLAISLVDGELLIKLLFLSNWLVWSFCSLLCTDEHILYHVVDLGLVLWIELILDFEVRVASDVLTVLSFSEVIGQVAETLRNSTERTSTSLLRHLVVLLILPQ